MELFSNNDSLFFPKLAKNQLKKSFMQDAPTTVVNMAENSNGYSIELPVEDGNKEDFSMHLENNVLTVSKINTWGNYATASANFESNINVPQGADLDNISIECTAGTLTITMPKK